MEIALASAISKSNEKTIIQILRFAKSRRMVLDIGREDLVKIITGH